MNIFRTLFGRNAVVEHAAEIERQAKFDVLGPESFPFWFFEGAAYADPVAREAPVPRDTAIQVPAVKRIRDLIAGTISQLPLHEYDDDRVQLVSDLLAQPERNRATIVTMALTLEDLVFGDGRSERGIAWWRVVERTWDNFPRYVRRIEPWRVAVDEHKDEVRIDGVVVPHKDLIRFDSPNDALLVAGARAIRTCLKLDATAAQYADDPQAREYFKPSDDHEPHDDDEIRQTLSDWKAARKSRSTGYVPEWLDLQQGTMISPRDLQLADARQHAVLEIARVGNVDPEELGVSTTSRTYANQFDRRKQFTDFTLGPFMRAIEQRLSMPDVTKRGRYVRFNLDAFLRSDLLTRLQAYEIGVRVGAYTFPEIRELEEKPALPEDQMPKPATQPVAASKQAGFLAANGVTLPKFDGPGVKFTAPPAVATFKVDQSKRTIAGLIVPFGTVGRTGGMDWSFDSGSLVLPEDLSRVKLLMDHDFGQAVGYATALDVKEDGIYGEFQLDETPEAVRALQKASGKVYDGLSVGIGEGGELTEQDGVYGFKGAPLIETSLTPIPAFDNARVHAVAASAAKEGNTMKCTTCGAVHAPNVKECDPAVLAAFTAAKPAEQTPVFSADLAGAFAEFLAKREATRPQDGPTEGPAVINPAEGGVTLAVKEALPYRFDRAGNFLPASAGGTEHVFSADLHEMARARDEYGTETEAGRRIMALVRAKFAVVSTDVNELNPTIQRPDMYVDQRDYRTPLWDFVNKGAPPNGVQPFAFPKFSSAAGLVGDHVQGTEPASGSFVTTDQTVTPTPLSGKASLTREVWDMGGNPAVSTLIWNQMLRGWKEGLETATATFLNTLTAATDITLATASANDVLAAAWDAAVADLQFIRGYDFEAFALEKELYKKFVAAVDLDGRKLFPQINPTNANGTSARRFTQLDLAGVVGVPSWALPSTAGSPNNSWLFDPATVHGWASPPVRLEFPGTSAAGAYAPVAMVDLGIWGYKAFANSDLGGVRQVIYDTTV